MVRHNSHELIEHLTVEDDLLVVRFTPKIFSRIGAIKNIELPEEGDAVEKGDEIASITGTEDDLQLKAPISGVILEINELFSDNLSAHKDNSKYSEWIVKIEPEDPDDLLAFEE